MKAELNIPAELVGAIADAVMARLKPILTGLQTSPTQADDLMGVGKYLGGVGSNGRNEGQQNLQRALPQVGYLRLNEVLALIPISKSTWWAGVAKGRFPQPTKKFGRRISVWDVRDIRALLDNKVA